MKKRIPISELNLTEETINDVCHCKYIDGIGNAQIGRYFNLTYRQVSEIIRDTKEFRAWIEKNSKWIPVYYKVDGKKIVTHFWTKKSVTKSVTPSNT